MLSRVLTGLICSCLLFPGFTWAQELPDEEEEPVYEGAIFIVEDTTWTKGTNLVFDKPVIVNGATLTIEEGVHVRFTKSASGDTAGDFFVQNGCVLANGTEADPIVFDRVLESDRYSISFESSLNSPLN